MTESDVLRKVAYAKGRLQERLRILLEELTRDWACAVCGRSLEAETGGQAEGHDRDCPVTPAEATLKAIEEES